MGFLSLFSFGKSKRRRTIHKIHNKYKKRHTRRRVIKRIMKGG